jgi:hypothetical protein
MNDIDTAAWPFVSEMIKGNPVVLDESAKEAVATWFMKVAVTARSASHVNQSINQDWATWLRTERSPVQGWSVWAGRFDGLAPFWYNPHDVRFEIVREVLPEPQRRQVVRSHGVLATMVIGYLIVQLFGIDGIGVSIPDEPALPLMWPTPNTRFSWPPTEFIGDDGLSAWAQRHLAGTKPDLPITTPRAHQSNS